MRKKLLRLAIAAALFSGVMIPVTSHAETAGGEGLKAGEVSTEIREVTTYVYDEDTTEKTKLLFRSDLPTVPYIDVDKYLDTIYTKDFVVEKLSDGFFVITSPSGTTMEVDTEKDMITSEKFASFVNQETDAGSALDSPYAKEISNTSVSGKPSVIFDLSKYSIDLMDVNGRLYFPLSTIRDMTAVTYNIGQYYEGQLYYFHVSDLIANGEAYYTTEALYEKLERDPAEAEFTYNEICFTIDNFYGAPARASLAKTIREYGFDRALDSSDALKRAKELLHSTNVIEFTKGLAAVQVQMHDGGHTNLIFETASCMDAYPDSSFATALQEEMEDLLDPDNIAMIKATSQFEERSMYIEKINEARQTGMKDWKLARTWVDASAALFTAEDTAIFYFDDFLNPVVPAFKEACDYAQANGIRNFIVDLGTNGGGSTEIAEYMVTLMKNRSKTDNQYDAYYTVTTTHEKIRDVKAMDLNLDGNFDEKDKAFGYDLNFAILTTRVSFSSANYLPVMAKAAGIPILGETSGGGGCIMSMFYMPGGFRYQISGNITLCLADDTEVDLGAAPDYLLVKEPVPYELDYSDCFKLSTLRKSIRDYYKDYANEWVDGIWYDKDGKANTKVTGKWVKTAKGWTFRDDTGWSAKNQWQRIDGVRYFFDKNGIMESDAIRDGYTISKNGSCNEQVKLGGWKKDKTGWYYELAKEGKRMGYLKDRWMKINGTWYYFDKKGYMASGEFVDGYWLEKSGAWKDTAKYTWHKSGNRWWYGNKKWYAKNGSYVIDGKRYYFNKAGYMASNEFVKGTWAGKNGLSTDAAKYAWKKSGNRWWYGNKKWYAKSGSYVIDGKSYTFDKAGYLAE